MVRLERNLTFCVSKKHFAREKQTVFRGPFRGPEKYLEFAVPTVIVIYTKLKLIEDPDRHPTLDNHNRRHFHNNKTQLINKYSLANSKQT